MVRTSQRARGYADHVCGFYFLDHSAIQRKRYLPQLHQSIHATILSRASHSVLTQTFVNPYEDQKLDQIRYTFPLFDGACVIDFKCQIGNRVIKGVVKEKEKARAVYKEAVAKGESAGLFEQLPEASDCFTTTVGNVPPKEKIIVTVKYIHELKHDAEIDGIRLSIPTDICPRYGELPGSVFEAYTPPVDTRTGLDIVVDIAMPNGDAIQKIQSPSHPISVSMGTLSADPDADFVPSKGSATLTLGNAGLETDFVLQVKAKGVGSPHALLEKHPSLPGQRAVMTTLVPKFALKPIKPEIIFVADRSGSMQQNVATLRSALTVFLKSLPLGVKFNIFSFGSNFSSLWEKSKPYGQESLNEAMAHVATFEANFGGTETMRAMEGAIKSRFKDLETEVMLLTDGDIWQQNEFFSYLNKEVSRSKGKIRIFTLGIGSGVSSALIEGAARAGNGFSQHVDNGEKFDSKLVRMLKAALTPHITDFSLEVVYRDAHGDTTVDRVADQLKLALTLPKSPSRTDAAKKKVISLFGKNDDSAPNEADSKNKDDTGEGRYAHLPDIPPPNVLQAPTNIPPLFPFSRFNAYLLLSPQASHLSPISVVLRGTAPDGPLELTIPIEEVAVGQGSGVINSLAAKKAVQELEEGRGWLHQATDSKSHRPLNEAYAGRFDEFVEREAVRLGVRFQVGGKWCSFVAVQANDTQPESNETNDADYDFLQDSEDSAVDPTVFKEVGQRRPKNAAAIQRKKKRISGNARGAPSSARTDSQAQQIQLMPEEQEKEEDDDIDMAFAEVDEAPPSYSAYAGSPPRRQRIAQPAYMTSSYDTGLYAAGYTPELTPSIPGGATFGGSPHARHKASAAFGPPHVQAMVSPVQQAGPPSVQASPPRAQAMLGFNPQAGPPSVGADPRNLFAEAIALAPAGPPPAQYAPFSAPRAQNLSFSPQFGASTDEGRKSSHGSLQSANSGSVHHHAMRRPRMANGRFADAQPAVAAFAAQPSSTTRKRRGYAPTMSAAPDRREQVEEPQPPKSPLETLIEMQEFSGEWRANAQLWAVLGVDEKAMKQAIAYEDVFAQADLAKGDTPSCLATAAVIAFMELKLAEDRGTWELVVDKAMAWLEDTLGDEKKDKLLVIAWDVMAI